MIGHLKSDHRRQKVGAFYLLAAAVLWSLNGLFIKSLYQAEMSGVAIAGYRSLFACLALTPMVRRRWRRIHEPRWVLATVLMFTGMCVTFVLAVTQTTVANAIVLQYTSPVWVFLLSPFITREHADARQIVSLCLSIVGVGIIFGWQYAPGQTGLWLGLLSGVVFGAQTVLFRRVRHVDPLVLVWLACGGSAMLLIPVSIVRDDFGAIWPQVGWLVLMGVVQFALPYVLFSIGLASIQAQQGTLLILLEPILSPVWVWLAHNEVPHVSTLVGGSLILASVAHQVVRQFVRSTARMSIPEEVDLDL